MTRRDATRWVTAILLAGACARCYRFALNSPLWWNEAFLAVNFLKRDFVSLLRPLDYNQVCPPGFLWVELAGVRALGFGEYALRLFPLILSVMGLAVVGRLALRALEPRAAVMAAALCAIAYHPIRLGSEVKPYSGDLFWSAVILALAADVLLSDRRRSLVILAAITPVALWFSYPALLVIAPSMAVLGTVVARRGARGQCALLAACIASFIAGFFLVNGLCAREQVAASSLQGMSDYWSEGFPAGWGFRAVFSWLARALLGEGMSFPAGNGGVASAITLALMVLGLRRLVSSGQSALGWLLALPLGLSIVAALAGRYPFGVHARLAQHLVPGMALLAGAGLSGVFGAKWKLGRFWNERRWGIVAVAAVLGILLVPLVKDTIRPYRTPREDQARAFAREFWPLVEREGRVSCLRWDEAAAPWVSANPDVALYLCNQAIYSKNRRAAAGQFPSTGSAVLYVHYWSPRAEVFDPNSWLATHPGVDALMAYDVPATGARGGRVVVFASGDAGFGTVERLQSFAGATDRSLIWPDGLRRGADHVTEVARKPERHGTRGSGGVD